jgi:hypothetical protein
LTGSPGRPGQFFLNQNNVILVKKKKTKINGLQLGFLLGLARSAESHRVFSSLIFSSTRPGFNPGSTRRAGLSFKTMVVVVIFQSIFYLKIYQNNLFI